MDHQTRATGPARAGRKVAKLLAAHIDPSPIVAPTHAIVTAGSVTGQTRNTVNDGRRQQLHLHCVTRHHYGTTPPPRAWDHLVPFRAGRR